MSQVNRIRAHLDEGRSITPIDALALFGTFRLAARVKDLRDQCYPVDRTMVERDGKRFAKYTKGRK